MPTNRENAERHLRLAETLSQLLCQHNNCGDEYWLNLQLARSAHISTAAVYAALARYD